MKNNVVAISGYSGSGKTMISEYIMKERKNFIYFDFGFLFRPLTYYLFNELNLTEKEIKKLIDSDQLFNKIKFSYKIEENIVKVGINNKFYSYEDLFNLKMNMDTVTVGTLIGDKLSNKLREIIDDIKKQGNVLLNARRPVEAYPDLDYHIFLKSDFDKRLERKVLMNNESYEITKNKLLERDFKEKNSGFWQTYDFTEIIDTTNLTKSEAIQKVIDIFDKPRIKFTYINNLTLVLGSYKCNKNCPYCIAKNNKKFYQNDSLDKLEDILKELYDNNIKLNRFVLSGNGEPSLYNYEELLKIKEVLIKYSELFNLLRIHTSGNIFFEEDKFNLFNSLDIPTEFEVLRVSLDSDIDKKILGYNNDYLQSSLLLNSKSIKCDVAFTDYLDFSNIRESIDVFLENNPNISKIRFKKLLTGDNENTNEANWVKDHSLDDDAILKIINDLNMIKKDGVYKTLDGKIVYKSAGDYNKDIVINNGEIQDYNYNKYNIKTLKKRFGK